jgi:hypothetical protein
VEEQWFCKPQVRGSTPRGGTIFSKKLSTAFLKKTKIVLYTYLQSCYITMTETKRKDYKMTKNVSPEMKSFMNDLWGAEGNFIDTPLGRGRIESVRTKAGIDLEVMVAINDVDGFTLFNGTELAAEHGIRS